MEKIFDYDSFEINKKKIKVFSASVCMLARTCWREHAGALLLTSCLKKQKCCDWIFGNIRLDTLSTSP